MKFILSQVTSEYGQFKNGEFVISKDDSRLFTIKWDRDGSVIEATAESRPSPYGLETRAYLHNLTEQEFDRLHLLVSEGSTITVECWEKMLFTFEGEDETIYELFENEN